MNRLSNSLKLSLANCGIREAPEDFIAKCIKKGWVKPAKPDAPKQPEPPKEVTDGR